MGGASFCVPRGVLCVLSAFSTLNRQAASPFGCAILPGTWGGHEYLSTHRPPIRNDSAGLKAVWP